MEIERKALDFLTVIGDRPLPNLYDTLKMCQINRATMLKNVLVQQLCDD